MEDTIAAATKTFGEDRTLDILVNCGGIGMDPKSWLDTSAEQMIYKYRVMTVVSFTIEHVVILLSCSSILTRGHSWRASTSIPI